MEYVHRGSCIIRAVFQEGNTDDVFSYGVTLQAKFQSIFRGNVYVGAQATKFLQLCRYDKNGSMTFQERRSNTHINQNFLEPLIHEHRINDKMFKLNAASSDNPQSDAIYDLIKPKNPVISFLDILYRFIRPYAAVGMVLKIVSISFLTVEKLSDVSPLFFMKKLQALVGCIFMQMYVSGFNQICDIELDKVNKPYLPLAARELSMETAVILFIISYRGLIDCMDWIQMFWTSIWIIEFAFAAAAFAGATSSITWSKYITIISHFAMALVLWIRAKSVDLKNMDAVQSMYMFLWQTFFRKRRNNTSSPLNKVELHETF
ncbi:homogentisate phytyltransferase 1, chloroplastic-like protein [Tanacetum coccineum]|uniref:Homogentisate phytyltransferase 1, chloroplastic-like protein n=1 Tax=Tanacetum coccineum TaxID=301880 RepID=A0ABQ5FL75_9ASTR